MVYRRTRPRYGMKGGGGLVSNSTNRYLKKSNYVSQQSGNRRHEFTLAAPIVGSASILNANEYFGVEIIRFQRTFTGAADTPPTASASNNYATSGVFNGSRVSNLESTIVLKNTSATVSPTIDIYEIALSYYDGLIWNTIRPTQCPVAFTTGVGVTAGECYLDPAKVLATTILDQDIKNYKFQQHYLKKVGTVTLGNTDTTNVATFKVNQIPPKCRRSQTGMLYAYIFANDSVKNGGATINLDYTLETKFSETPTDLRLPFIE